MISHIILSFSAVQIYELSYSLYFLQLPGYITNSQRGQLHVGLIAQLVEHCTGIGEAIVLSRSGLNFFQAEISQLFKLCS